MVLELDPPMSFDSEVVAKLIELAIAIESGDPFLCDSLYRDISSWIADHQRHSWKRKAVNWFCDSLFAKFLNIPNPATSLYSLDELAMLPLFYDAGGIMVDAIEKSIADDIINKPLHLLIISTNKHELFYLPELISGIRIEKVTLIVPAGGDHIQLHEQCEVRKLIADNGGDIVKRLDEIQRSNDDNDKEAIVVVWMFKLNSLLHEPGVFEEAMLRVKSLKPKLMVVFELEVNLNCDNFTKRFAEAFHFHQQYYDLIRREFWAHPHETLVRWRRRLDGVGFSQIPLQTQDFKNLNKSFRHQEYEGGIIDKCSNHVASAWRLKDYPIIVPFNGAIGNHRSMNTPWKVMKKWSKEEVRRYLISQFDGCELMKSHQEWYTSDPSLKASLHNLIIHPADSIAPLIDEKYYVNELVIDEFFKLLKRRSDEFPGLYIKHYSLPTYISRFLLEENWDLMKKHFKIEDNLECMQDASKVFMPVCIQKHWILICIDMELRIILCLDSTTSNRLAAANEIIIFIIESASSPFNWPDMVALTWASYGSVTDLNSYEKRNLYLLETAFNVSEEMYDLKRIIFREWNGRHCKNGGLAEKALQSNVCYIFNFEESDHPINGLKAKGFVPGSALAIGLKSKYFNNDHYVIEFFFPPNDTRGEKKQYKESILYKLEGEDWTFVSLLKSNESSDGPNLIGKNKPQFTEMKTHETHQNTTKAVEDCGLKVKSSRKRKNTSEVWEGFTKVEEKGKVWALCKVCNKKLRGESTRGTSNLHLHLKNCLKKNQGDVQHNDSVTIVVQNHTNVKVNDLVTNVAPNQTNTELNDLVMMVVENQANAELNDSVTNVIQNQANAELNDSVTNVVHNQANAELNDLVMMVVQNQANAELNDSATNVVQNQANAELNDPGMIVAVCDSSFDQETSSLDLAKMIIKHGYPVNMGQHEFFQVFVKNLQPSFKINSQDDIKADALRIYKAEKERLIKDHCNLCSGSSLTVDLRSYGDKKIIYCCLILCFIDDEWELKQITLAFKNLGYVVTPHTLHEVVQSVLSEWNIDKNVLLVVANDTTCANYCMFGEFGSMPTNPSSGSSSGSIFVSCKQLIDFLYADIECATGTFLNLESAVELSRASIQLQQFESDFNKELEKVIDICKQLKVFHDSLCTSSRMDVLFESLISIHNNLLEWKESEHSYVRNMTERMMVKFDWYWDQFSLALGIMAVFDPRFKLFLVEYAYEKISDANYASSKFSKFRDVLASTYDRYANASNHQTQSSNFRKWKELKGYSSIAAKKNELDIYLAEEVVELEKDCDVLAWWRANAGKYPVLSRMARDYLAVSMSNIASKSSRIREIMKRNPGFDKLESEVTEALICGQDWL